MICKYLFCWFIKFTLGSTIEINCSNVAEEEIIKTCVQVQDKTRTESNTENENKYNWKHPLPEQFSKSSHTACTILCIDAHTLGHTEIHIQLILILKTEGVLTTAEPRVGGPRIIIEI